MSTYVYTKAVRYRIEEPLLSMQFKDEENGYEENIREYLDGFTDLVDYNEPGKFSTNYGVSMRKNESYIDFIVKYEWDACGDYARARELTAKELDKYIPKFKELFEKANLPCPDLNVDTLRVVEYCYYNGSDAPICFDLEDEFHEEV